MTTYQEYQKKIGELQALAEAARKEELSAAKEKITAIMREHGLTLADLSGAASKSPKAEKTRNPVPMKYRDPTTGQSWTGRGRAPKWLEGKNKADFIINS
jgi:DNA-binding protein H-NS